MCYEQPSSKMNRTVSASGEQEDMRENNSAVVMGVGGGEGWGCGARETTGCRGCPFQGITTEMPA